MAKVIEIRRKDGQGVFSPQEVKAQQAGATIQGVPVIAWDHRNNAFGILNQGFMAEACVIAERAHIIGRVVAPAQVVIPGVAVVGDVAEAAVTVPEGQLWFINQINVTATAVGAGERVFNIEVDMGGGAVWNYFPANQPHAVLDEIVVVDLDQLGAPLRLVGGNTVTLRLTVSVDHAGDAETSVITLFGSVGRRIV